MPAAAILALALPLAKEVIIAWMQASGKDTITLDDLKTKSPDDILKEMGI